jgi:hypothetical protein
MARKANAAATAEGTGSRDLIATAKLILASEGPAIKRLRLRQEMIDIRASANRSHVLSKLTDSAAKFGGGSLLTAALVLYIQRQAGTAALAIAGFTLLLFVTGTIFSALLELSGARRDAEADGLQAVLDETET